MSKRGSVSNRIDPEDKDFYFRNVKDNPRVSKEEKQQWERLLRIEKKKPKK